MSVSKYVLLNRYSSMKINVRKIRMIFESQILALLTAHLNPELKTQLFTKIFLILYPPFENHPAASQPTRDVPNLDCTFLKRLLCILSVSVFFYIYRCCNFLTFDSAQVFSFPEKRASQGPTVL